MRLTLRTLLAWLDTVLPPDEQKNLGEKVATSPVAPQLIARIRDVVERPVLAAPRPEGRGLADDANSVAEYLDNTLPVERLEAFERVCIESDVHLAEVAACHGILAEIAREPLAVGTIDTASRRRLLTAIRHQVQAPNGVAPAGGRWPAAAKPGAVSASGYPRPGVSSNSMVERWLWIRGRAAERGSLSPCRSSPGSVAARVRKGVKPDPFFLMCCPVLRRSPECLAGVGLPSRPALSLFAQFSILPAAFRFEGDGPPVSLAAGMLA